MHSIPLIHGNTKDKNDTHSTENRKNNTNYHNITASCSEPGSTCVISYSRCVQMCPYNTNYRCEVYTNPSILVDTSQKYPPWYGLLRSVSSVWDSQTHEPITNYTGLKKQNNINNKDLNSFKVIFVVFIAYFNSKVGEGLRRLYSAACACHVITKNKKKHRIRMHSHNDHLWGKNCNENNKHQIITRTLKCCHEKDEYNCAANVSENGGSLSLSLSLSLSHITV